MKKQKLLCFIRGLRWGLGAILGCVVLFVFLAGLYSSAISWTATHREYPESWLLESGVYTHLDEAAAELAATTAETESPVTNTQRKEFETTAEQVFHSVIDRDMYRRVVTGAIDGVYDWLNGETVRPTFTIRIFEDKQHFRDFMSVLFKTKLKNMPECGASGPTGNTVLGSSCRPHDYQPSMVDRVLDENSGQSEFDELYQAYAVLDAESMSLDEVENPTLIRNVFTTMQWLPVIWTSVILLLGAFWLLVLKGLANTRKLIGWALVIPGVVVAMSGVTAFWAGGSIAAITAEAVNASDRRAISRIVEEVLYAAVADISQIWIWSGMAILACGSICLLWRKLVVFFSWVDRKVRSGSTQH